MAKRNLNGHHYPSSRNTSPDNRAACHHKPRRNYWGNLHDEDTYDEEAYDMGRYDGISSLYDSEDDHDSYYDSDSYY